MVEKPNPLQTDAVLLCGYDLKPGFNGKNKFSLEVGGTTDILENTDNPNLIKSRSDDMIFTAYESSPAKTVLVTFANGEIGIARWRFIDHLYFLFVWDDSSGHHNQWIYSPSLE